MQYSVLRPMNSESVVEDLKGIFLDIWQTQNKGPVLRT